MAQPGALQAAAVPHTAIYRTGTSPSHFPVTYLPATPALKRINRVLRTATHGGASAEGVESMHLKVIGRRNRVQVGSTNRWRLINCAASDLLGSRQASKSGLKPSGNTSGNHKQTPKHDESSSGYTKDMSFSNMHRKSGMEFNKPEWYQDTPKKTAWSKFGHLHTAMSASSSHKTGCLSDSSMLSLPTASHVLQMQLYRKYCPMERRCPTPAETFIQQSQAVSVTCPPDLTLIAFKTRWDLHRSHIKKSAFLMDLFSKAEQHDVLDSLKPAKSVRQAKSLESPSYAVTVTLPGKSYFPDHKISCAEINIGNPLITKQALAYAFLSLYDDLTYVDPRDAVNVMAAAQHLKLGNLTDLCTNTMLSSIDVSTACIYYKIAVHYKIGALENACKAWMLLKLFPELSRQIFLGHMPEFLLKELLQCKDLFLYNEYGVYRLICSWIFLQQQPLMQTMPEWSTIVTWFMSFPKLHPWLLSCEGRHHTSLFKCLRVNGIIDPAGLDEIRKMNIVPGEWMLEVLQNHYYCLQGGGDMGLLNKFESGSVRYGFVIDKIGHCHTEIISMHGFYFELNADWRDGASYDMYIKRLKPNDPILPFRICERQTFSMRQDREVQYSIRVQWLESGKVASANLGLRYQPLGFGSQSSRSDVLKMEDLKTPAHVLFSLLFPPS